MPTNKPLRPSPVKDATPLTRSQIEEIARKAARDEVQRLLGDEPQTPSQPGDALLLYIDHDAPPLVPTPQNTVVTNLVTVGAERRFIAHLPTVKDQENQIAGTHNKATGQVVLDDAKGVYANWEAFHRAFHEQGKTPTTIVWEGAQ